MVKPAQLLLICLSFLSQISLAQKPEIKRIDPQFWWHNLETRELQLLIYGTNTAQFEVDIKTPGVQISQVKKLENPNYLLVYINLGNYHGHQLLLNFKAGSKTKTIAYKLETLQKESHQIDPSDLVYLVFPDRFSNGDTKNDVVASMRENWCSRDSLGGRHGGDLQGIINKLDYLQDLGASCLWLNPTLINDQPAYSYHGYALTDHYLTDPRLGSNEIYKKLGSELQKRNMKLMMDLVPNHIGSKHWMMLDMPDSSFVNQWPTFTRTNYRATTHLDPYASEYDKKRMVDGWFDTQMPDVNQRKPWVATYLMQSYLWWINYAGIDAFRIDTYSYNDYEFMDKCMAYIQNEYPDFYSTGEIWEQSSVLNMAYFTQHNGYKLSPKSSHLTSAKDFQLFWAIMDGLNQQAEWDKGLAKIYHTLCQDGLYENPNLNLTFIDNHDLNRFFTEVKEDFAKWKMGIGLLMTLRGVPSIYYGTEILLTNPIPRKNDGQIRQDFPGAWPSDTLNKFTPTGRTAQENEAFNYIKKLAQLRKNNAAFKDGKLMQFTPEGSSYVFFRYTDEACFMIAVNSGSNQVKLDTKRMEERLKGYKSGFDHASDQQIKNLAEIDLAPKSIRIIELMK
jgi:neopullulanase